MTIKFKDGSTKEVSNVTGESLNDSIEKKDAERIVFSDTVSGVFTVRLDEVESCQ